MNEHGGILSRKDLMIYHLKVIPFSCTSNIFDISRIPLIDLYVQNWRKHVFIEKLYNYWRPFKWIFRYIVKTRFNEILLKGFYLSHIQPIKVYENIWYISYTSKRIINAISKNMSFFLSIGLLWKENIAHLYHIIFNLYC